MNRLRHCLSAGFVVLGLTTTCAVRAEDGLPDRAAIRAAITKSLPLLEAGARGSMEKRPQCFTCHNQGLPILALALAKSRDLLLDSEHLDEQLQFTADFLKQNAEKYREGKGQGGAADTAGYALWTLDRGGWLPDETTAAVVEYLLIYQKDRDHWRSSSRRPPSEQGPFTTTFLALRGLRTFGSADQKDRIDRRIKQVRRWLLKALPHDTEDRVFRLRALREAGASDDEIRQAAEELLATQRPDGGWAQTFEMESDAYATGSTLAALHEAGRVGTDHPAYRKGLRYLITTQREDGSWHVVSYSKPFQLYFESGYPYGKDQFISISAGSWATVALTLALPTKGR